MHLLENLIKSHSIPHFFSVFWQILRANAIYGISIRWYRLVVLAKKLTSLYSGWINKVSHSIKHSDTEINCSCCYMGSSSCMAVILLLTGMCVMPQNSRRTIACNAGEFLERERWIILRCCHLGPGSARGLEPVKSDPKGEDDRLRNASFKHAN